ncbi:MAG TPA: cyanophycinase, partial [Caldilineaceae bacterium]|nr:cyanophycinase [Caldilineaceae bacterium]
MAIGGAEDKVKARRILSTFLSLAGGNQARIVVIPSASMQPDLAGARYHALFHDLGAAKVDVLDIDSRTTAQDVVHTALLHEATALFLTGGNQLRLSTLLGGTRLAQTMRQRHAEGLVVAGTSAGASFLCQHMIAFGRTGEWPSQRMVQLTPGLGLTNRVIIDQHFQRRGRTGRLMVAVAYNPFLLGLGIDEDTAAVLNAANTLEVVGRGSVIVVDGSEIGYTNVDQVQGHQPVAVTNVRIHVLTDGFRYDLVSQQPELPRSVSSP